MKKPRRIVFYAGVKSKSTALKYGKIIYWDKVFWYEVEVAGDFATRKECFGFMFAFRNRGMFDLKYEGKKVEDEMGEYDLSYK